MKIGIFVPTADLADAVVALRGLAGVRWATPPAQPPDRDRTDEQERWRGLADDYGDQVRRTLRLLEILEVDGVASEPLRRLAPGEDVRWIGELLREAEEAVRSWRKRHRDACRAMDDLDRLAPRLRLAAPIGADLEEIGDLRHLRAVVALLSEDELERLQMPSLGSALAILPLHGAGERVLAMGLSLRTAAPILQQALRDAGAELVELPEWALRPAEQAASEAEHRRREVRWRLERLEGERRRLVEDWRRRALGWLAQARLDRQVLEAMQDLEPVGGFWVAWIDVSEERIRELLRAIRQAPLSAYAVVGTGIDDGRTKGSDVDPGRLQGRPSGEEVRPC